MSDPEVFPISAVLAKVVSAMSRSSRLPPAQRAKVSPRLTAADQWLQFLIKLVDGGMQIWATRVNNFVRPKAHSYTIHARTPYGIREFPGLPIFKNGIAPVSYAAIRVVLTSWVGRELSTNIDGIPPAQHSDFQVPATYSPTDDATLPDLRPSFKWLFLSPTTGLPWCENADVDNAEDRLAKLWLDWVRVFACAPAQPRRPARRGAAGGGGRAAAAGGAGAAAAGPAGAGSADATSWASTATLSSRCPSDTDASDVDRTRDHLGPPSDPDEPAGPPQVPVVAGGDGAEGADRPVPLADLATTPGLEAVALVTSAASDAVALTAMPPSAPPPQGIVLRPAHVLVFRALERLYSDPVRPEGELFRDLLVREYNIRPSVFEQLRLRQRDEKVYPEALRHPPPAGPFGRVAYTNATRSWRTRLETATIKALACGAATMPKEGEKWTFALVCDAASRYIFTSKLAHLLAVPLSFTDVGALTSTITLLQHQGPLHVDHRVRMMAAYGEELRSIVTDFQILGRDVYIINMSDFGDAPSFYQPPSLYSPQYVSFMTLKKYGIRFFSAPACGRCRNPGASIFALPSQPLVPRTTPPSVRGLPGVEIPYFWGVRCHGMAHGPPCVVAQLAIATGDRRAFIRVFPGKGWAPFGADEQPAGPPPPPSFRARGPVPNPGGDAEAAQLEAESADVCGTFGTVPRHAHDSDSDAEPAASAAGAAAAASARAAPAAAAKRAAPGDATAAAGRGRPMWTPNAPPHSVRPRDGKDFVGDSCRTNAVRAAVVRAKLPPLEPPPESIVGADRPMPVPEFWDRCVLYFKAIRGQSACISRAEAERCHAEGRLLFEYFKVLAARCHPFDGKAFLEQTPPEWYEKLKATDATAAASILKAAETVRFRQHVSLVSYASHMFFEHGWDLLLDPNVPFDQARRATEEAGDHLFCYLYYTLPALCPRIAGAARNAERTLQCTLEAEVARFPHQSGTMNARIRGNRAYV